MPGKRLVLYASKGLNPRIIHSFFFPRPASICLLSEVMHCFFTIRTHSRISVGVAGHECDDNTRSSTHVPIREYTQSWYIIKRARLVSSIIHIAWRVSTSAATSFEFMLSFDHLRNLC